MLSALGIALGIAALIAVTGVSASSKAHLLAQLDRLGSNLLTISPGKDLDGTPTTLPPQAEKMLSRIGPVQQATAITTTDAKVYRSPYMPKDRDGGLEVVGARRNLLAALHGEIQAGRWLDVSSENCRPWSSATTPQKGSASPHRAHGCGSQTTGTPSSASCAPTNSPLRSTVPR
ncbi:ABC transporter permease [Streptomyces sp. Go40/10]|uniref:ABC transporter permease n=1 Tax=Streptomyces sp. Go40/10 TaxID=2825844 RepID=UPI001E2AC98C|nr:ABC transporter permease [Streptomyces sp. Go40/10]UFQ99999.1 ABC transporter permease [Streptomyces sp. Go40/10]